MAKKTSQKRQNRRVAETKSEGFERSIPKGVITHRTQEPYDHIDPPHYQRVLRRSPTCPLPCDGIDLHAIDVIETFGFALDGHLSHALTYLLRLGRKPGVDDIENLKKARWWIDRAISYRQGHPESSEL